MLPACVEVCTLCKLPQPLSPRRLGRSVLRGASSLFTRVSLPGGVGNLPRGGFAVVRVELPNQQPTESITMFMFRRSFKTGRGVAAARQSGTFAFTLQFASRLCTVGFSRPSFYTLVCRTCCNSGSRQRQYEWGCLGSSDGCSCRRNNCCAFGNCRHWNPP